MISEGHISLAIIAQADGASKKRPVLLLRQLPGYGDFLVCGISTQLHHEIKGFDLVLSETNPDFSKSGLHRSSLFRLSFLAALPKSQIIGKLGVLAKPLLKKLQSNLSKYLVSS